MDNIIKIILGLISLVVVIAVDILVGWVLNLLLLQMSVLDPTGYVIVFIILLNAVGLILLWEEIASFFTSL